MPGTKKSGKTKQAPLSSHPIFPVVVALWFAALLGFGSLVIPGAVFEKLTVVTGIASVVEAAQPPLGTTARLMIAGFSAVIGAVAGLLIARKVARAQKSDAAAIMRRNDSAAPAGNYEFDEHIPQTKKPISAHEELGHDGLDAPLSREAPAALDAQEAGQSNAMAYRGKRRSLAVTDDSGPSDFLESAPLPGGAAGFDSPLYQPGYDEPEKPAPEPLELAELALEENPITAEFTRSSDASRPFDAPTASSSTGVDFHAVMDDDFSSPANEMEQEFQVNNEQTRPAFGAIESIEADVERIRAEARDSDTTYNPFAQFSDEPESPARPFAPPQSEAPSTPAPQGFASAPAQAPAQAANPFARDLRELSMAELVERFAAALQSNAASERTAAHAPVQTPVQAPVQAKVTEEPVVENPVNIPAETAAPLVFRRSNPVPAGEAETIPAHAPAPTETVPQFDSRQAVSAQSAPEAQPAAIPFALRPFDHEEFGAEDSDDEVDEVHGLSLRLSSNSRSFNQTAGFSTEPKASDNASGPLTASSQGISPQPRFAAPQAADAPAPVSEVPVAHAAQHTAPDNHEETAEESAYSSLLSMKSQFSANQEFVRIDDEDVGASSSEPVVVFPGQDQRQASPAPDGPTRNPIMNGREVEAANAPRPFDAPVSDAPAVNTNRPTAHNAGQTERALREALEKLQRMSGTA
ncbi:hypothetical protein [Pontixanthobacter gangjinensis]|uniref:Uncharacterized protein n=1 Tax=Pontixanthobacter gangjinensis TaxID=1028742 RepID=A0A6I4SL88_9SPHN|nr:hypothetical protein [Pontixanthobacter gangjinensis]MXO55900.1 hypothetical protein [Pontixanthobacter gangjinensis]